MEFSLYLEPYNEIIETAHIYDMNTIVVTLAGDVNDDDIEYKVFRYTREEFTEEVYNIYKVLVTEYGDLHSVEKLEYDNIIQVYNDHPEFFTDIDENDIAQYTEEGWSDEDFKDYLWDGYILYNILPKCEYSFCHTLCDICVSYAERRLVWATSN